MMEFVDDDDHDKNVKPNKRRRRKAPGCVGYYVAVSHVERTVLIGMKGTLTFEDLLTDCCGRAVHVDLDGDPHRSGDMSPEVHCNWCNHCYTFRHA